MRILVTGVAGFIGSSLVKSLSQNSANFIIGVDNVNSYYDVSLKYARLEDLGIYSQEINGHNIVSSHIFDNFFFAKIDIESFSDLEILFKKNNFDVVINLAAQAGVRYSLDNPRTYINSNIVGFFNVIDLCKTYKINRFIYASSSSVYGLTDNECFSELDKTDTPISLYAATKKSNELMAYTYSHLYGLTTIGLRFFTVYGPWGRPDMAPFIFSDAICNDKTIKVFNHGNMKRDFTYIDDIVEGIVSAVVSNNFVNYNIFNIGNSKPVNILKFIRFLETEFNKKAKLDFCQIQPGDVVSTWADINKLKKTLNYTPTISIENGVKKFANWYKKYYNVK
jgi:UDP-glucuronate 4-epimerase